MTPVLCRIALRAALEVDEIDRARATLRVLETRRIIRAAIEEAVHTLPATELLSLLDDRQVFHRVEEPVRRVA